MRSFCWWDQRQLRVQARSKKMREKLKEIFGNDFALQLQVSLQERLIEGGYPFFMLHDQFRVPRALAELPTRMFYNLERPMNHTREHSQIPECRMLQTALNKRYGWSKLHLDAPELLIDVEQAVTEQMGTTRGNPHLVTEVADLLLHLLQNSNFKAEDFKIIVFYSGQAALYREALDRAHKQHPGLGIQKVSVSCIFVATVDSFQGGQGHVTIVDLTVAATGASFVGDGNRLNVNLPRRDVGRIVVANAAEI